MKLCTTSMGRSSAKISRVLARSASDTVVTASLCAIDQRVVSTNEGSLPTSVMSVPCSVVTTGSGRGWRMLRARIAETALGTA